MLTAGVSLAQLGAHQQAQVHYTHLLFSPRLLSVLPYHCPSFSSTVPPTVPLSSIPLTYYLLVAEQGRRACRASVHRIHRRPRRRRALRLCGRLFRANSQGRRCVRLDAQSADEYVYLRDLYDSPLISTRSYRLGVCANGLVNLPLVSCKLLFREICGLQKHSRHSPSLCDMYIGLDQHQRAWLLLWVFTRGMVRDLAAGAGRAGCRRRGQVRGQHPQGFRGELEHHQQQRSLHGVLRVSAHSLLRCRCGTSYLYTLSRYLSTTYLRIYPGICD